VASTRQLQELLSDDTLAALRAEHGDRADAVVSLIGADEHVLWATSPGSRGIFGRTEADFEGVGGRFFLHPSDYPSWKQALTTALQGEVVRWEGRGSDASGSWVWTVSTLFPTRAGDAVVAVTTVGGAAE